jgi:hypothetical protein
MPSLGADQGAAPADDADAAPDEQQGQDENQTGAPGTQQ